MYLEKGDQVEIIAINPEDLPSDHLESFVGKVGTVTDLFFRDEPEPRRLREVTLQFENEVRESFFVELDTLAVISKEPDWML